MCICRAVNDGIYFIHINVELLPVDMMGSSL